MKILEKPPPWLLDYLPQSAHDLLEQGGWWVVLGFLGLVVLLLVWALLSRLGAAIFSRRARPASSDHLTENLASFRPPAHPAGPKRLTYEGHPVRLRLVVAATRGKDAGLRGKHVLGLLDRVVVGLREIAEDDSPRIRVWPPQNSYEGFAFTFHRSTPVPEGDGNPSRWIPVVGRAKIGKQQVLLGLVLWSDEKTTLARRTLQPDEWRDVLRIKQRK